MRYQLLKTSPYLGGQIRWDIPIYYRYDNGVHNVDTPELHIVPLNDDIIFNEDNSRETFNYSHIENIKYLYNNISSSMFSAGGEWSGQYWLYNDGDILDPYSHIYNMGARRMRFTRYNKQFSYLCPLWISEETNPSDLEFELSLMVVGEERDHIVRRRFKLSDAICNYMKDYLYKSAGYKEPDPTKPEELNKYQGVNNNLLSIKFDPDYAFITGVNVETGCYSTVDVSYMITGLLSREVPMMEFDNMLVSKFRESHMIAQQLINLNFAFNMDDISYMIKEPLLGKHITVAIKTIYDGEYLPLKDFYTNYTNIPAYRVDRSSLSFTKNVCDYLNDDKILDYIHINKFTQPIFHWTMVENPTYIYNFYDGFAPVFEDSGDFVSIKGKYYNQADISQDNHTVYNGASNWCKVIDLTGLSTTSMVTYNERISGNLDQYTSQLFMNFDTGVSYLNNNRYDFARLNLDEYGIKDLPPVYVFTYIMDPGRINYSSNDVNNALNASLLITNEPDKIILKFECDDIGYSTYRRYKEHINYILTNTPQDNTYTDDEGRTFTIRMEDESTTIPENIQKLLKFLIDMYDCWIPPYRIDFKQGIITKQVEGFDNKYPVECNMFKYNDNDGYVLRYTGALCPLFIDPEDEYYKNINYRYNQWGTVTDKRVREYSDMLKTGLLPSYPSIDFYSFESEYDSMTRPQWYNDNWPWEVAWKNDGVIYILPEQYKYTLESDHAILYTEENEENEMWSLLYTYITELGIPINTPWLKHRIKSLYTISYDFDYASETDIEHVVYHIKFNLK